nr:hypothetical protein [Candidatus Gracilibacteria bacterium]
MNKKYYPYIGGAVAVVLVGALLFLNVQKTQAPSENLASTGETNTGFVQTQKGVDNMDSSNLSLWQRYVEGKIGSIKCILQTEQEGGKIDQIVYIAAPKMRMDSTVTHEAGNSESHMISDGEYTYVWGTNGPALKMKVQTGSTEVQEPAQEAPENTEETKSMSQYLEQIPYNKCSEWIADDSMFKLPDGINFVDMEEFQNNMMNGSNLGDLQEQMNKLKSSMPDNK